MCCRSEFATNDAAASFAGLVSQLALLSLDGAKERAAQGKRTALSLMVPHRPGQVEEETVAGTTGLELLERQMSSLTASTSLGAHTLSPAHVARQVLLPLLPGPSGSPPYPSGPRASLVLVCLAKCFPLPLATDPSGPSAPAGDLGDLFATLVVLCRKCCLWLEASDCDVSLLDPDQRTQLAEVCEALAVYAIAISGDRPLLEALSAVHVGHEGGSLRFRILMLPLLLAAVGAEPQAAPMDGLQWESLRFVLDFARASDWHCTIASTALEAAAGVSEGQRVMALPAAGPGLFSLGQWQAALQRLGPEASTRSEALLAGPVSSCLVLGERELQGVLGELLEEVDQTPAILHLPLCQMDSDLLSCIPS